MNPVIITPRLELSRLLPSDAPAMFAYRSDSVVCRFQNFAPTELEEVEAWMGSLQGYPYGEPGTWFQFGIRRKDSGQLAGDIGAHFLIDDPRQVEIGFTLAPEHQGQGLGTEAVAALIDHQFRVGRKHRVIASVDPRNRACLALLGRLGLREEAHFRQSLWFKGEWVDDKVFAILQSEWEGHG